MPRPYSRADPAGHHLFLVGFRLGLVSGSLVAATFQSRVTSRLAELGVGTALDRLGHLALLDLYDALAEGDDGKGRSKGRHGLGLGEVDVLAVTGLGVLGALAGEDDQSGLVGLEAGDIGGQGLFAEVLATVVDGDTDGGGHEAGDTGFLQTC